MISDKISIRWIGIRKDANKGSFWGYFVPLHQPDSASRRFDMNTRTWIEEERYFYKFSGKIGKSVFLERGIIDDRFIAELDSKLKNFKYIETDRFFAKCGTAVIEGLKEQLSFMLLTGDFVPLEEPPKASW